MSRHLAPDFTRRPADVHPLAIRDAWAHMHGARVLLAAARPTGAHRAQS